MVTCAVPENFHDSDYASEYHITEPQVNPHETADFSRPTHVQHGHQSPREKYVD